MSQDDQASNQRPAIFLSPTQFFNEAIEEALSKRKMKAFPMAQGYLVKLLEYYMNTEHLFDEVDSSGKKRTRETLAETYLKAANAEPNLRNELLKKLGDRSLYISGFFGDSLQRKLVDIDYYADMGGAAYGSLAELVREDTMSKVYRDFSERFLDYVEVLTFISTNSFVQSEENLLRLYETYARTGSDLARERLLEKGLIAVPLEKEHAKKKQ